MFVKFSLFIVFKEKQERSIKEAKAHVFIRLFRFFFLLFFFLFRYKKKNKFSFNKIALQ